MGQNALGGLSPNFLEEDIPDLITCFKFGDDRFRGLASEGQILPFPIDFDGRPYNTHTTVWACDKHSINLHSVLWRSMFSCPKKQIICRVCRYESTFSKIVYWQTVAESKQSWYKTFIATSPRCCNVKVPNTSRISFVCGLTWIFHATMYHGRTWIECTCSRQLQALFQQYIYWHQRRSTL